MTTEKSRENRLRGVLRERGYSLSKSPQRHPSRAQYGAGYMVHQDGKVVFGYWHREYQATLEQVEVWASAL